MPIQVIIALILITLVYIFGDWRNWTSYYTTILFFAFGDLMYRFLFDDRLLWVHHSFTNYLSDNQIELIWILIIYPCTVLLFLPCYLKQKSLINKIGYFLIWIIAYSLLEFVLLKSGRIAYKNNWNFYWSVAFYFFLFPILIIHYYKPLWPILASSICGITLMYIFLGTIKI